MRRFVVHVIVVGVSEDKQRMFEAGVEVETHSLGARAVTLQPADRKALRLRRIRRNDRADSHERDQIPPV
jgi:hypothetical protein